jgi:hypothetical protein
VQRCLVPFLGPRRSDRLDRSYRESQRQSLAVFAILFLWQFPHFLAIALMYQRRLCSGWVQDAPPILMRMGDKTLYSLDVFQKLTAVEIEVAGDSLRKGSPRTLFHTGDPPLDSNRRLRRVARRPASRVELHHRKYRWVVLVTNWTRS